MFAAVKLSKCLENLKLFEMPLLGFLGFPALALDSIAGFALFSRLFMGNQTWEDQEDLLYRIEASGRPRYMLHYLSLPLQICFWVVVSELSMQVNLGSVQLELSDLRLGPGEQALFRAAGCSRPRQLRRLLKDRYGARRQTGQKIQSFIHDAERSLESDFLRFHLRQHGLGLEHVILGNDFFFIE